jgi:DUF4097 and DUF4098 domain-containing protein YvlB
MKNAGMLAVLLTIIMLSVTGTGCSAKYTKIDKSDHKIDAVSKRKLVINNIMGNIKINRGSSSEVTINAVKEVKVKKRDKDKPFNEVTVNIDTTSEIISVETEINENSSIFQKGRSARVDYTITVPETMDIEIENISGNVLIYDIKGDIDIELVDGDIDLAGVTGRIVTDIANGDITANIDSTDGMDLNTVNGSVRLSLSEELKARVKADVANGRITYEQLRFTSVFEEKGSFRGTLGSSDVEINIEVVNGKVRFYGKKSNVI